jgi:hypothetical protein
LERERIEKRLELMRAKAERLEADIAERMKGNDDGIAEAEGACRVSECMCRASREHVLDAESAFAVTQLNAKEEISRAEVALSEERNLLAAREKGEAQAIASLQAVLAKRHVVLENVEGSKKRAENLRRRIALIEARHADVLKSEEPQ